MEKFYTVCIWGQSSPQAGKLADEENSDSDDVIVFSGTFQELFRLAMDKMRAATERNIGCSYALFLERTSQNILSVLNNS